MKKIQTSIKSKIEAVLNDNFDFIAECDTVADYLTSNLNEDSDYWWYLEYDGDDSLTEEDKEMVEKFITDNYNYKLA